MNILCVNFWCKIFVVCIAVLTLQRQVGSWQWAGYYTGPQSFITVILMFSHSLANNFEDFNWIFIDSFIKLSVQTFQLLFVIYRRGNFEYYHGSYTKNYWLLSYPLDPWILTLQRHVIVKLGLGIGFLKKSDCILRQE